MKAIFLRKYKLQFKKVSISQYIWPRTLTQTIKNYYISGLKIENVVQNEQTTWIGFC